jgi:hypothetical protein
MILNVIGGHGRDYHSAQAAAKDWAAGEEFYLIPKGPYVSQKDCDSLMHKGIKKVAVINRTTGKLIMEVTL